MPRINIFKNDDESEYSSSDYDSSDEEYEIIDEIDLNERIEDVLGVPIYETPEYKGYFPSIINFLSDEITPYSYNNKINRDHMKQISKRMLDNKYVHGIYYTGTDEEGNIFLLDGHHRYKALQRAYKKNNTIKPHIHVINYLIDDIHTKKTRELFNRINKVKPFNNEEEYVRHAHNIVAKLREYFPTGFKDVPGSKSSNRPYLHLSTVYSTIKDYLIMNEIDEIDDDEIVDRIMKLNESLKSKVKKNYKNIQKKVTDKQLSKMKALGLYLSLIKSEEWLID